jgi:hypothetical protein
MALQSVVAAENSIAGYAMRAHSVNVLVSTHGLQRSDGYISFSGEAGGPCVSHSLEADGPRQCNAV